MGLVHAKEFCEPADPAGRKIGVDAKLSPELGAKEYPCGAGTEEPKRQVNLDGIEARVDKIFVDGLARTKDDIVIDTVKDLFKATDFQDVVVKAHKVRGQLERLGCFRNIGIFIDTSSGPGSTANGLEVTFHVRELKRIVGGVNTMVGNNEGQLVMGLRLPNLAGRGEKLQAEYAYGSRRTSNLSLTFSKPMMGRMTPVFSTSVFQQGSEWPSSGYKNIERGLLVDLGFTSAPLIHHNLQWEGTWREMSCLSRSSPFQVREQAGHSVKSALRHILSLDRRDSPIFPTAGCLFQLTSELAGIGGNVGFLKNDVMVQGNWSIFEDVVVQAALQGGLLKRLSNDKTVGMCDQFYLGGPLSLRGFHTRGIANAIGSDVYWAAGLHLFAPLPFRPGKGGFGDYFRTHVFFNAGNAGNFQFTDDYTKNWKILGTKLRATYGIGLAMRLGQMARVELNYCIPLYYTRDDQVNPGWQFGIGCHFL